MYSVFMYVGRKGECRTTVGCLVSNVSLVHTMLPLLLLLLLLFSAAAAAALCCCCCWCVQSMYNEYRSVTETEKAEVVGLGGLHVVGTGEEGLTAFCWQGISVLGDCACVCVPAAEVGGEAEVGLCRCLQARWGATGAGVHNECSCSPDCYNSTPCDSSCS
jgi:hypothetical protein